MMTPDLAIRDALRGALARHATGAPVTVRTQTTAAAAAAPALLAALATRGLPTGGHRLTRQDDAGHTLHVCICGINSCGDGSVCG